MYILKRFRTFVIGASSIEEIKKIKKALHFIDVNAPRSFSFVNLIHSILVRPRGTYDNMLFPEESVYVCEPKTVQEASMVYLASLLIHEGVHMKQWKRKEKHIGNYAEHEAYKSQRNFLKKFGTKDEVGWLDKCFEGKWWIDKNEKKKGTSFSHSNKNLISFCKKYIEGRL